MRALTLTQPYASLVSAGAKRFETRSWSTKYRGPLAIHAGAGLGPVGGRRGLDELCGIEPFRSALIASGFAVIDARLWRADAPCGVAVDALPRGAIVAVCDLVHVYPCDNSIRRMVGTLGVEAAFGNFSPGRYAWDLRNVRALHVPLPCSGQLGLWAPPELGWYHPDAAPAQDIADTVRSSSGM